MALLVCDGFSRPYATFRYRDCGSRQKANAKPRIGSCLGIEFPAQPGAGDPQFTRLLLGLGLTNFSMHPAHLLTIKQRVLSSNAVGAKQLADRMRRTDEPEKLAALLDKLNA